MLKRIRFVSILLAALAVTTECTTAVFADDSAEFEVVISSIAKPKDTVVGFVKAPDDASLDDEVIVIEVEKGSTATATNLQTLPLRDSKYFFLENVKTDQRYTIYARATRGDTRLKTSATVDVRDPIRLEKENVETRLETVLGLTESKPTDDALIKTFIKKMTEGMNNVSTVDTLFNPEPPPGSRRFGSRQAAAVAITKLLELGLSSPDEIIRLARQHALSDINDLTPWAGEQDDRKAAWKSFFDFVDQEARKDERSASIKSITAFYNNLIAALRNPELTDQSLVQDAIDKRLGRIAKELSDLGISISNPQGRTRTHRIHRLFHH